MMNLQEVMKAIDHFSPEELHELRAYLDRHEAQNLPPCALSPEERARRLDEAFAQLREGLTPEQLDEMTNAMNEEYIEPWDESEWQD